MPRLARIAIASAIASLTLAGPATAATDGQFGETSTGTVTINASVAGLVRISGLRDVDFTNHDPTAPATDAQNVCVFSNTDTRGYNITATGDGTGNAFTLSDGPLGDVVPYTVEWAGSSGQTTGTALTSGTALTGLTSTAAAVGCAIAPPSSASLIVSITAADLQTMPGGAAFTGVLTLVVAPE
jgi:hypothetical protein